MASNRVAFFNGTCEVFDLRNCTGQVLNEFYMDPCSCYHYYRCSQSHVMLHQRCAEGSAWDYITKLCKNAGEVTLYQDCEEDNAWHRCNVSEPRLKQLEGQCKQNANVSVPLTIQTTLPTPASSGDINPGVIIGAVIAGAVLTAILIIAIGLYRRRMKSRIPAKRPTIANNPEYFEGGNSDDPYAIIHDAHISDTNVHHPTHSSGNGTIQNGFEEDVIEYDNTGATTADGYTSTMRRSIRDYETPVRANGNNQTEDKLDVGTTPGTSTDENGNEHRKQIDISMKTSISSNSSHDNISTLTSSLTESDSAPNYYKLEKIKVLAQEQDDNN